VTDWARLALCREFADTRVIVVVPPNCGPEICHLMLDNRLSPSPPPLADVLLNIRTCRTTPPRGGSVFPCACGRVVWMLQAPR